MNVISLVRAASHVILVATVIGTTVVVTDGARSPALAATKRCFGATPTIRGTAENDRIEGTDGPDVIVGGGGNDILYGGSGNDRICGGRGSDSIIGQGGDDRLGTGRGTKRGGRNIGVGGPGDDTLVGGPANDQFSGDSGDDVMRGRGGPDLFYGEGGTNRIDGGPSEGPFGDLIQYFGPNRSVNVNLERGRATAKGRDFLSGIESVTADGTAKLIGNDKPNFFVSQNHADTLVGKGGADCLYPGAGENVVRGGSGVDGLTANPSNPCGTPEPGGGNPVISSRWVIDLEAGEADYGGSISELYSIEDVYGSREDDQIYGDARTNILHGGGSADEIHGRAGNDRLDGGSGADSLDGGEGTDTCLNGEAVVSCE